MTFVFYCVCSKVSQLSVIKELRQSQIQGLLNNEQNRAKKPNYVPKTSEKLCCQLNIVT